MKRIFLLLVVFLFTSTSFGELNFGTILPEKKWALCIGASDYQSITKLKYSGKDAVAFSKFLVSYGFRPNEVSTLSDEPGFEKPTAKNVYAQLDQILRDPDLEQGDQFIVFFSGHGVGLKDGDYWLPTDADPKNFAANAISIKILLQKLSKAGLKNVTILSDACRAGEKNPFGQELIRLGKTTNIAILLGCAPGAKSYELPTRQQGAFTYYLTRSLQNEALADPNTGAVWVSRIGAKLQELVSAATQAEFGKNRQVPAVYADAAQDVAFGLILKPDPKQQFAASQAMVPNKWHRVTVLSKLAVQLKDAGKYEEAIEVYKALESLGYLSDSQLLGYSFTLGKLSRDYETTRIYDKFIRGKPLTNRRAALTLIRPAGIVTKQEVRQSVAHLRGKFEGGFQEIDFLASSMIRHSLPHPEIAEFIRNRLKTAKLTPDQLSFLTARALVKENKKSEAFAILQRLVSSSIGRDDVVDEMLLAFTEVNEAKLWLEYAKGTSGLSQRTLELLILIAWEFDRKNLHDYTKQVLDQGILPTTLLKLSPRLLHEKAISREELMGAIAGSPLSFDHNLARWFISCIERDKYGDTIPDSLFAYGASRSEVVREAFELWMEFASIEEWKPEEYKAAWTKKKEILASFRPHLKEISENTQLLSGYLTGLIEAGFSPDAYYWTEYSLELSPDQQSDSRLTGIRLLAALNVGDRKKVSELQNLLGPDLKSQPKLAAHLIFDHVLRGEWDEAKKIRQLVGSGLDAESDFRIIVDVILAFRNEGKDAAIKRAESYGVRIKDSGIARKLTRMVEYLVTGGEPGLALVAALKDAPRDWDHVAQLALLSFQSKIEASSDPKVSAFGQVLRFELCKFPGAEIFAREQVNPGMALSDYVGEYGFDLSSEFNMQAGIKRLDFRVGADGKVEGTIDKWKVQGTIDALGNLDLRLIVNGEPSTAIMAKLPSLKMLQSTGKLDWKNSVRFAVLENRPLLAHFSSKFNLKK